MILLNKKNIYFLRNVYSEQELKQSERINDLKQYYEAFEYFLHIVVLLNKYYNKDSEIEFVDHDVMENFLDVTLNSQYDSFLELHKAIEDFKIKTTVLCKNSFQNKSINKIIRFVYTNIMKFPKNAFVTDVILSNNFLANVCNIIFGREVIHHSHIAGEIIGYAHNFCNQKVRQNKNQISVIAHNLFGFDIFFFLKGLRLGLWQTTNLSIGASNLTNINYASIGEQIKFIDIMKYY